MAGSILGKDQVDKVNSLYAKIYSHVANLLAGTPSPVEAMRVHVLTEYLDTTELSKIFMELPFLSPAEKRALVRTAIFDVLLKRDVAVSVDAPKHPGVAEVEALERQMKIFTPPSFKLNVATVDAHQQAKAPVEAQPVEKTPAVLTKLSDLRKDAKTKHDVAEAERQEAVAEIRNDGKEESAKVEDNAVSEGA